MLELFRNASDPVAIRIVGVGGAGGNVVDRIQLDGLPGVETAVLNTDSQALGASVAQRKLQIGEGVTRGLGAGGDPELGYQAVEESVEDVRELLAGAGVVFLCTGLGGGTGSGAGPMVAHCAKEHGAFVVVFATLPFSFEGKRRQMQAQEALDAIRERADLVVCFENARMGGDVGTAVQEAFAAVDRLMSRSVRSVAALVRRPGLIRAGVQELRTVLRGRDARCLFGFGSATGPNRAHEALEMALKSPLMERGKVLSGTFDVLVNVSGGPDLALREVEVLMNELNRHIEDHTRVHFSLATDSALGADLEVVIIGAAGQEPVRHASAAQTLPAVAAPAVPAREPAPHTPRNSEDALSEPMPPAQFAADEPGVPSDSAEEIRRRAREEREARLAAARNRTGGGPRKEAKQEQMQFEPLARGRFEKSEPTVVDGQDLDVPTFLRRKV